MWPGYFAAGSHRIIPVDHCPISSPKLNEAIATLRRDLSRTRPFETTVELFTNETDVQVNVQERIPPSARPLFEALGTGESIEYAGFRVSRGSFFQVNRFLLDRLIDTATAGAGGDTALDLYAGVGLFAKRLKDSFDSVSAVEPGNSAFGDLKHNVPDIGERPCHG